MIHTIKYDIALVAPAGTGKTTIRKSIMLSEPDQLGFSVSATTRSLRDGEKEGKDYYHLDKVDFIEFAKTQTFLEYNLFGSTYYGTFRHCVENIWNAGKSVVYDIDIKGAVALRNMYPRIKIFFIEADPVDEIALQIIEERLRKRGTESEEKIKERLSIARDELKRKLEADFIIPYGKTAIPDVTARIIIENARV